MKVPKITEEAFNNESINNTVGENYESSDPIVSYKKFMPKLYYCFNKGMGLYVVDMKTWEKKKGTKEYWESFYGE